MAEYSEWLSRFEANHVQSLDETLPMLRPCAIEALMAHDWPGNVRELENVVQRALVLHENAEITAADIMINAGNSIDLPDMPALEAA